MSDLSLQNSSLDRGHCKNYWGPWSTLGFGLLTFFVFAIIQTLGLVAYVFLSKDNSQDFGNAINAAMFDGDAIGFAEIPAALAGVAMILLFAATRDHLSIKAYLDLYIPKLKSLLFYLALIILAMILMESINYAFDRPTPEFMIRVYSNTDNIILLWVAVSIAAPFFEEFLFRGFLLNGLNVPWFGNPMAGTIGAVILTSASFAVIHVQYGWFEIISIFFIGLLLAIAKLRTGSLYIPIAMHMAMNVGASIMMELNKA